MKKKKLFTNANKMFAMSQLAQIVKVTGGWQPLIAKGWICL